MQPNKLGQLMPTVIEKRKVNNMAIYHNPETKKQVEARNIKEALKAMAPKPKPKPKSKIKKTEEK